VDRQICPPCSKLISPTQTAARFNVSTLPYQLQAQQYIKPGNVLINVTLRSVRVTIVAVEKQ